MTLQEAIEIQIQYRKDHHFFPTDRIGQAEQLGIEAMARELILRREIPYSRDCLLPSETED